MDRYGTFIVKFEVDSSSAALMVELAAHVQKVLEIIIKPPKEEKVFGKIAE